MWLGHLKVSDVDRRVADREVNATQALQYAFAAHIRHPERNPKPNDVSDRRMGIYRDLFYNNIESFISNAFPVLRGILSDSHWHAMVRDFMDRHHCKTPYFPEISEEFLEYVQLERGTVEGDPAFMVELAHYEWAELALDIAMESVPLSAPFSCAETDQCLKQRLALSPLAWNLTYQWPVHKVSPTYQPSEPPEAPTYLLVYRNRSDQVRFMEMNPVTARLVSLIKEGMGEPLEGDQDAGCVLECVLNQIAEDLQGTVEREMVYRGGIETVKHLVEIEALIVG